MNRRFNFFASISFFYLTDPKKLQKQYIFNENIGNIISQTFFLIKDRQSKHQQKSERQYSHDTSIHFHQ